MRRTFVPRAKRETPVEESDIDPNPRDDFHPSEAERTRRALQRRPSMERAQQREARERTSQQARLADAASAKRAARAERHAEREAAGDGFTVTFERVKETKGAFQFAECDARGNIITDIKEAKIGSVYLRKDALDGATPQQITITVAY